MFQPLILVVDDDPAMVRAIQRSLRSEPFRLHAEDGAGSVMRAIENESPAVALIDWHLHGNNAQELIESMALAFPRCVVIVFSGDNRPEERRRGINAGAWMWVNKLEAASLPSYVAQAMLEHERRASEYGMSLTEVQGRLVSARIARFGGNLSAAASSLGIHRNTAKRMLERWQEAG
ncbi:MAG: response regulator [Planctomycetota bacterium]